MRLSELAGKEMIDLRTGTRSGVLGGADLWIDEETGLVHSIVLAPSGFLGKKREEAIIPWSAIVKIGPDMIILDSEQGVEQAFSGSRQRAYGTRD